MKKSKPEAGKKKRIKKLYWLLFDLAVAAVVLALLLYKPAAYKPLQALGDGRQSKYLTHVLLPELHNRVQRGQPFDLDVTAEGINDIIAHSDWPKETGGASFSAPLVLFVPENIVVMGTVTLENVEVVVTIGVRPSLNEEGLLNLEVVKVKVGAVNLTPIAKIVARRMYKQQIELMSIDRQDIRAEIAASLLNDEPFDPVFEVRPILGTADIKVRIEKVSIEQGKLTMHLAPLRD